MKLMPITPVRPQLAFGAEEAAWKKAGFPNAKEYYQFLLWCDENDKNQYGDEKDTMYPGGTPFYHNPQTLYEYATDTHPTRPWKHECNPKPEPEKDFKGLNGLKGWLG